jgi:1-acyl-sn-glycerol-3-phosphate acyltransferase
MAELVYPPVIATAKFLYTRAMRLRFHMEGTEHIPRTGGAVLACNHVSYLDFIFCGFPAERSRRLVRFMAKEAVFHHRISGPLMRGMHHIPVDRSAGAASYKAAVEVLRDGEVVGVFPEATISRSFTVKEFKSGATRMATEADVPLVPVVLWGTQRMWTKGRPRKLWQRRLPITILVDEPLYPQPGDDCDKITAELRNRMSAMLERAQREYPEKPSGPEDSWWLPAYMGGSAPTPEEAARMNNRD